MKTLMVHNDKPIFFLSNIESIKEKIKEQLHNRMSFDEVIGEDEVLLIEDYTFPLSAFLERYSSWNYHEINVELVSLEDKFFGSKDNNFVIMKNSYSFDSGDEPSVTLCYVTAHSEKDFIALFKEQALKAFNKTNDSFSVNEYTFSTSDYVSKNNKEIVIKAPNIFSVSNI